MVRSTHCIKALPKLDSPFDFTTTLETNISGYSKAKARLDERMGDHLGNRFKPWRVHELRRTAAGGMAALGFQPHVIERLLNHMSGSQGGLVGLYQRYEYLEERKKALHAWGARMWISWSLDENLAEMLCHSAPSGVRAL